MTTPTRSHPRNEVSEAGDDLSRMTDRILERHRCVGLAAVFVAPDGKTSIETRGVAHVESGAALRADTVVRVASISKTFTAIAVMQLWESGAIDLDGPVNDYLRSYRLVPVDRRFPPVTIRHLLTHTGGLGEVTRPGHVFRPDFGESFAVGTAPTLAEFYRGSLPVVREPGGRWLYTNHGPATLGQLVADVRNQPLRRCLRDGIFDPLGMNDTDVERSVEIETKLATGYEKRRGTFAPVVDKDMVTTGAAGVFSTPADMARYLTALAHGGRNEHGTVLRPETLAMMYAPHHQPDPRIPGTGLGFWREAVAGGTAVGHQGTIPGFHSDLLVAPEPGRAVFLVTNGSDRPDFWIPVEARRLLASPSESSAPATVVAPRNPKGWKDFVGWYRLDAGATDVRVRGMLGLGAEVFIRGGELMVRFLSPVPALMRGLRLTESDVSDADVFRIDLTDDGFTMHIVFARDIGGVVDRIHLDLMPLTLRKQPASTNPRRIAMGAATATLAAATASTLRRLRRSQTA